MSRRLLASKLAQCEKLLKIANPQPMLRVSLVGAHKIPRDFIAAFGLGAKTRLILAAFVRSAARAALSSAVFLICAARRVLIVWVRSATRLSL